VREDTAHTQRLKGAAGCEGSSSAGLGWLGFFAVAAAYVEPFSVLRNWHFQCLDRFVTEEGVVDEPIFTFEVTKDGIMPLPVGTRAELRLVHIFEMHDGKVSKELVMDTPAQPLQERAARVR
jgi:hypothetical protein